MIDSKNAAEFSTAQIPVTLPVETRETQTAKVSFLSQIVLDSFICGGLSGGLGIIFAQPLDVIRVRLQTNDGKLRGMRHCATELLRNEGPRGFFKGVASPVISAGALTALLFCGYEMTEYKLTNGHRRKSTLSDWIISGACGGLLSAFVTSPSECVARRAQVDRLSSGTMRDEVRILRNMWSQGGLRGIYCGFPLTLLRDCFAFITYFSVYKSLMQSAGADESDLRKAFLFGGVAGSLSWFSIYPLDVIKTKWQIANPGTFRTPMEMVRQCARTEGRRFIFKGMFATMIRAFPQHAITFLTYEYARAFLDSPCE